MFNTTPSNQINIDPVLTRDQLPSLGINYSKVTLLRLERAGKFPQRFYLTQRAFIFMSRQPSFPTMVPQLKGSAPTSCIIRSVTIPAFKVRPHTRVVFLFLVHLSEMTRCRLSARPNAFESIP